MTGRSPIIESVLQVHGHLEPHEYEGILDHWTGLDHRLRSYAGQAIEMHLFVNERDTASQHLTLEVKVPGHATVVASAHTPDLTAGLHQVRDVMIRRLTDLTSKAEPRRSRLLRDAGRRARRPA